MSGSCPCAGLDVPAEEAEGPWAGDDAPTTIPGMRWFRDRTDAGRQLAERLLHLRGEDVVVLGLPCGGVPVAFEVARALGAALEVLVVRKFGMPFQPGLVLGAVGEGGVLVLNEDAVAASGVQRADLAAIEARERAGLERRAVRFHDDRPRVSLSGRTAVVVDDGMVTGATARAACTVARAHGAARVVLAVPACPPRTAEQLRGEVDELVVLETPADLYAVGQVYAGFRPVRDGEVVALLHGSAPSPNAAPDAAVLARPRESSGRAIRDSTPEPAD